MFEINDVVIIRKTGDKPSYTPILNKKGVVVDFVSVYDNLTMTTRRKYYVDVTGYKNDYHSQGYYVFEDETCLERAYQDTRVWVPDELDAIAYAMKRKEFCIEKENKTMEILEFYKNVKKGEILRKKTKALEKLKSTHPVIKAVKNFADMMKDVKGFAFNWDFDWDEDKEFYKKIEETNNRYDKQVDEFDANYREIKAMLTDCETYEQKQNILKAYGVIDEHGKLRK